jgi:ribosomal protein L16 Arg81 hydroxylase
MKRGESHSSGSFDLARLIAPIDVEAFGRWHWEREPLLVQRSTPSYYDELLSLADTDRVLTHTRIQSPDVRLVREGQEVPLRKLRSEGANRSEGGLEALYQEYRGGSTIILSFLHERWPPLRKLCQSLATETSAAAQINVYITPPGAQGFAAHYDSHDVFVVQTAGSKRWQVFGSPTRLPLAETPYDPERADDPGPALHDVTLHAGDLLYIPRGYVHSAASLESLSVHLTVGVMPISWASIIRDAVKAVCEEEVSLRESLPLGFAQSDELCENAVAHLEKLLATTFERIAVGDAIRDAQVRARALRSPSLEGHLEDLDAMPHVSLDTALRLRPGTEWMLRRVPEGVVLEFHGKRMRLPTHAEPATRFVVETNGAFKGRDLPGTLDAEGTLVLLRRLLKEGLLTAHLTPAGKSA